MEEKRYDVIIIGGGPAGYSAALYSARAGLSALVIEKLSAGGQMATTSQVENYPGYERVDGFELGMKMQAGAESAGADSLFAEVQALELQATPKRVVTSSGSFLADAVILATGAQPRRYGLEHEQELVGRGVSYCATCDGMFYRGKTVAVAGGGNSAAEDALVLSKLCRHVYLIHRRDTLRASKSYRMRLEQASNVEFIWNAEIVRLAYAEKLQGLTVRNRETGAETEIACNGLFIAIGRTPDSALGRGPLELDEAGYIPADETTRTAIPGVFAAGDVRTKPLRQIVTAAADGAVAAKFAEDYLNQLPRA